MQFKPVFFLSKQMPDDMEIKDVFASQLVELFEVENPSLKFSSSFEEEKKNYVDSKLKDENQGVWVNFPWCKKTIHIVNEKDFNRLRTNRNKNLISEAEQTKLLKSCVAFAGLSIGSNMVGTLVHNGIGKNFKLADFDTLETCNLNRIRTGVGDLGNTKLDIVSEEVYEAFPFAEIFPFRHGLNEKNLDDFVKGDPKPNIIFEAIDNLKMKLKLRMVAKEAKVPVVMLTNLGDNILIDVERYDIEDGLKIFNGKLEDKVVQEILLDKLSAQEVNQYAVKIVGLENIPKKAVESVKEVGKTLVGRPQLMSTVTIASGISAFLARKIILGEEVKSGRKVIALDSVCLI